TSLNTILGSVPDSRRYAGDDGRRGNVLGNHAAGPDHGAIPDPNALEDDGACSDPDPVAELHGMDQELGVRELVLVGIHDDDVARDHAVVPDRYRPGSDDLGIAIEVGAVPDPDQGSCPAFEADATIEAAAPDFDATAPVFHLGQRPAAGHADHPRLLEVLAEPEAKDVARPPLRAQAPRGPSGEG